jgi:hypothetical protein
VSALLPRTLQTCCSQPGGEGWLSITVRVPSGRPVAISALFADRSRGLRVFGSAWRAAIRRQGNPCPDTYQEVYGTSARNYREYALTPEGLAVGVDETGACGPMEATVPNDIVRPYLSTLGKELIAGVRRPR